MTRLEQNLARIMTQMVELSLEAEGQARLSSVFDLRDLSTEISDACKCFIDSLYSQSEQSYFIGSFVDAYDVFMSGMSFILLKRRGIVNTRDRNPIGDTSSQDAPDQINDMVNKCCTLIAGVESRFGAVKAFRRVLRDFSAVSMGQPDPSKTISVSGPEQCSNQKGTRELIFLQILRNLPDNLPRRIPLLMARSVQEHRARS